MEKSPQLFTIEAINALVPHLNEVVGRQLERRGLIEARLRELAALIGEVPEAIVMRSDDPNSVSDLKRELISRIEEYQAGWKTLEDLGAVLKDARTGLLDFLGNVDGQHVWLCWKYGETEVLHYHALDEGYTARKELRTSMKQRTLN